MTTECVVEIGLETHFETWNFFTILDVYTHQLSAHTAFFSLILWRVSAKCKYSDHDLTNTCAILCKLLSKKLCSIIKFLALKKFEGTLLSM